MTAAAGPGGAGRIAAVTGATGFLGSRLAVALVEAGWAVRILVRAPATHPVLEGIDLQRIAGDLQDEAALERLVRGATVVVHAAGLVKARSTGQLMQVNRDGTGRLARIVARQQRPARFILVSSQAAREPQLSGYAASKRLGETAAQAALGIDGCVVLRPCVIYGPWDLEGLALLRLARRRFSPVLTAPEPRIAMIHVGDAAAAIAAVAADGPSSGIFEICDERPDGYGWRELLRRLGAAQGRQSHPVTIPDLLIRAAGAASEALGRLDRDPAMFGCGKVHEILHRDWSADLTRQLPADRWGPRISLVEGLADTVQWARSHASGVRTVALP